MRLDLRRVLVLGLSEFSGSLIWRIYNTFLPVFYSKFIASTGVIGFIMTIDNITAVTISPYFGALSDRTQTRYGRRMPFLMVGMTLAALLVALMPFGAQMGLWTLLAITILMNLSWSVFRTPSSALMPDIVPSPLRSRANGILMMMVALGAMIAFFAGGALYSLRPALPFLIFGGCLFAAMLAMKAWIREPAQLETSEDATQAILPALKKALANPDKSLLLLCCANFLWTVGFNGVETLFSLYARDVLGISAGTAAITLGFFAVSMLLMAVPAGIIGTRIGRRKSVMIGLAGLAISFTAISIIANLWAWRLILLFAGATWAMMIVNAYPMIVDMCLASETGTYSGIWTLFSSVAAILAPPLFGFIIDATGFDILFKLSAGLTVIAFILVSRMRSGEARAPVAVAGGE